MSIRIGLLTAAISAVIAFLMGNSGRDHGEKSRDGLIIGLIDLVMGNSPYPFAGAHILCTGKGILGCCDRNCADALDFPARLIRGEVLQLKQSQYIKIAEKLGQGKLTIALKHMTPHLIPPAVRWAGSDVSPCDPARSQHHISGLWTVAGTAGHRCHFVGKHEISSPWGKWWLALFQDCFWSLWCCCFILWEAPSASFLDPAHAHQ